MTKYFCDRCGKVCAEARIIKVPYTSTPSGSYITKETEVCKECENKFWQVHGKIAEIGLVFFRDFMNTGERLEEKHKKEDNNV